MSGHLGDLLRGGEVAHPERLAIIEVADDGAEHAVTYGELARRARGVATRLDACGRGGRALVVASRASDMAAGVLGAAQAGVVAVPSGAPARPTAGDRALQRILAIAADAEPRAIVTARALYDELVHAWPGTPPPLVDVEQPGDAAVAAHRQDTAMLLYTSGSTAHAKGVVLTHDNVLANLALVRERCATGADDVLVSWLPLGHVFGLHVHLLHALSLGARLVALAPAAFALDPGAWLAAISRHRGTFSGAPASAYAATAERVGEDTLARLDLSSWRHAACGGEPARPEWLARFAERFAACGFTRAALRLHYGLTEASGMVTAATTAPADSAVGWTGHGIDLAIVDPVTRTRVPDGVSGEVWVSGPIVAAGYHQRPADETFGARLADDPARSWLRTGDLGLVRELQLTLTGRLKDLVIIRGHNHHPGDLERTAAFAHPILATAPIAAFAIDGAAGEELVITAELARPADPDAVDPLETLTRAVRRAIAEAHGVRLSALIIVDPGRMPRTPSGKLQRSECRALYLTAPL